MIKRFHQDTKHLSVVAFEKGAFWSPMTKVANFTYLLYSYVHENFISALSLLNDLMKILVGIAVFSHVIFKE